MSISFQLAFHAVVEHKKIPQIFSKTLKTGWPLAFGFPLLCNLERVLPRLHRGQRSREYATVGQQLNIQKTGENGLSPVERRPAWRGLKASYRRGPSFRLHWWALYSPQNSCVVSAFELHSGLR